MLDNGLGDLEPTLLDHKFSEAWDLDFLERDGDVESELLRCQSGHDRLPRGSASLDSCGNQGRVLFDF